MHPLIVRLGPVVVSSYGLLLALSFILGLWLASVRARRMGLERKLVVDASFWIVLTAMTGARLYYIVQHFGDFAGHPLSLVFSTQGRPGFVGGLSMYGSRDLVFSHLSSLIIIYIIIISYIKVFLFQKHSAEIVGYCPLQQDLEQWAYESPFPPWRRYCSFFRAYLHLKEF